MIGRLRLWFYEVGCRAAMRQIRETPVGYHVPDPNALALLCMELDMDNPANMELIGIGLLRASGRPRRP